MEEASEYSDNDKVSNCFTFAISQHNTAQHNTTQHYCQVLSVILLSADNISATISDKILWEFQKIMF